MRRPQRLITLAVALTIIFLTSFFASTNKTKQFVNNNSKLPLASDTIAADVFIVTRIIDGDTVELNTGDKVRYIGINTPESVDPRRAVQCFGKESVRKNEELVGGQTVRLVKDVSDKDKYGRLLRYVYVGETFINLELVKQGYARVDTVPPDVNYQDLFMQAEHEAKLNKSGLWGKCQK